MPDASRWRAIGQILLLTAGFLVLVAISIASVLLVNKARNDSGAVTRTVEAENQINALLLEIRRAESAARGFLLTQRPELRREHDAAVANIVPYATKLEQLVGDNPIQADNLRKLRAAVDTRLDQFVREMDFVRQNNLAAAATLVSEGAASRTSVTIRDLGAAMRAEEERLLAMRTINADRSQVLASSVTIAGSSMVIALAAMSIFLVRRSSRVRDEAEAKLRDYNLDLEATVNERTADLREANDEIQRFAYIVSHDLRSPLVNIMGFTSELEELRGDIFKRIARLGRAAALAPSAPEDAGENPETELEGHDKQLSDDFTEALGFIKSSIAKMDRLISAILNLSREGRREFSPERINMRELIEGIGATVAHQAAEADTQIRVGALPNIVSDRLALEQIFSNLIDNALKYLRPGVLGDIEIRGRTKLGFAVFDVIDNGRGIEAKDHQRIFDLFRRAGTQDKPGQGIGLAHVRALVRRLGGTMSVASELNQGSTFTVTLPINWKASAMDRRT
ncbi:MAG TPA: CHASE3 domain-containing protein [Bradyrhizobium sp.]